MNVGLNPGTMCASCGVTVSDVTIGIVKFWVAVDPMPFEADRVRLYELTALGLGGVPESVAVPLWLSVRLSQPGAPLIVIVGLGHPRTVIGTVPSWPALKTAAGRLM